MKEKNLNAGHRKRMRDKYLKGYEESFFNHELLEIFLFYCIPVANTNRLAHDLIKSFGGISEVFNADKEELLKINGISDKTAEKIVYIKDFIGRYGKSPQKDFEFFNSEKIAEYYVNYFKDMKSDIFLFVSIDPCYEFYNRVSIPVSVFTERKTFLNDIAKTLIKKNMHHVVIGINHRNGSIIPTSTDYNMVQFFSKNLKVLDIIIEDCFVCSNGRAFSMRKNGMKFNDEFEIF